MNVTRADAQAALRAVDAATRQSRTHLGYQFASLALLVWGALWIVAGASVRSGPTPPAPAGLSSTCSARLPWVIWSCATPDASPATRTSGGFRSTSQAIRFVVTAAVVAGFAAMTGLIFGPLTATEIMAFITVLIAAIYMVIGLWTGLRLFAIGAVLAALVVSAFLIAPVQLPFIVSLLGGSALILGGLWMRWA